MTLKCTDSLCLLNMSPICISTIPKTDFDMLKTARREMGNFLLIVGLNLKMALSKSIFSLIHNLSFTFKFCYRFRLFLDRRKNNNDSFNSRIHIFNISLSNSSNYTPKETSRVFNNFVCPFSSTKFQQNVNIYSTFFNCTCEAKFRSVNSYNYQI
jgi:hypothetical protein